MRINKSKNVNKEGGIETQNLSAPALEKKLSRKIQKAVEKLVPSPEAKQVYANALPSSTEKYYRFIPLGRLFFISSTNEPVDKEGYFVVTTNNKYICYTYANKTEYQVQIVNVEWRSSSEESPLPVIAKILKKAKARINAEDETLELEEL